MYNNNNINPVQSAFDHIHMLEVLDSIDNELSIVQGILTIIIIVNGYIFIGLYLL